MYSPKENKITYILLIFFLLFVIEKGNGQSLVTPPQTGTIPQTSSTTSPVSITPTQTLITDRSRDIPIDFKLKSKIIDISLITGYTFTNSQQTLNLGIHSGVFINPFFEIGGKFSFESLKTYKYIFDTGIFSRLHFMKDGDTIPFFHLEGNYVFGKKLKGFVIKTGLGVLQRIKDFFNIHLSLLCDLWFFTYRFNSDEINTNEEIFSKFRINIRLIFGLTFLID